MASWNVVFTSASWVWPDHPWCHLLCNSVFVNLLVKINEFFFVCNNKIFLREMLESDFFLKKEWYLAVFTFKIVSRAKENCVLEELSQRAQEQDCWFVPLLSGRQMRFWCDPRKGLDHTDIYFLVFNLTSTAIMDCITQPTNPATLQFCISLPSGLGTA